MLKLSESRVQAITTRYVGPGNVRGSRIIATTGSGKQRVTVPYQSALSSWENHAQAVLKLCAKLNWTGNYISGGTERGYVWVCDPSISVTDYFMGRE